MGEFRPDLNRAKYFQDSIHQSTAKRRGYVLPISKVLPGPKSLRSKSDDDKDQATNKSYLQDEDLDETQWYKSVEMPNCELEMDADDAPNCEDAREGAQGFDPEDGFPTGELAEADVRCNDSSESDSDSSDSSSSSESIVLEETLLSVVPGMPDETELSQSMLPGVQLFLHVRLGTLHCRKPLKPAERLACGRLITQAFEKIELARFSWAKCSVCFPKK